MTVTARLFDGLTGRGDSITVDSETTGLVLPDEIVPWDRLYVVDRHKGVLRLGHHDRKGWRLVFPANASLEWIDRVGTGVRFGGWIDRIGLVRAVAGLALASGLVVAIVVTAPRWLGPLTPMAWERVLGDILVGDLDQYSCATPASTRAIDRLVAEIDPGSPPVRVSLVKLPIINAAALPGGRVAVFDGLVQDARSPDELAGVLAHEVGHVRKRHVMQALLRQFGLSLVTGGANTGLANTLGQLTAMRYSREAESEADAYARERLAVAGISPEPTAAFFARLRMHELPGVNAIFGYFASHPDTAERERAFLQADRPGARYRPALDGADFAAIKSACREDHRAKSLL